MSVDVTQPVVWVLAGLFGLLVIASVTNYLLCKKLGQNAHKELSQRINSWWVMVTVFTIALVASRNISIVLFAFVSFLALKEYFSIIPTRRADRRVLFWAYLSIPIQYYWVATGWYGMFIVFIPVYVFLFLPTRMIMIGETQNFLRAAGTIHWGLMTLVFSISHVAFLLVLPDNGNPVAGGPGLVLFLVFLTQFNDIAQYMSGKTFGCRKIVPKVSPNKTVEGLAGGIIATTLLAVLLSPFLTPFDWLMAMAIGCMISVAGFIGDVTVSALKRDIGVKDSGSMLPGHGGILDRIDSLTYTAPLFFHIVHYVYY